MSLARTVTIWAHALCFSAFALVQGCDDEDVFMPAKEITSFTFRADDNPGLSEDILAQIDGDAIAATLPPGTGVTSLVPSISFIGKSLSPAADTPQDFSDAVQYTVSASDRSTRSYTVRVSVLASPSSAKEITKFTLAGVDADISGNSITLTLPHGTVVSALAPSVSFDGQELRPASDTTHDFSAPLTYTVQAADGTERTYTVTVNVAPSDAKDITQFKLAGIDAVISGSGIGVTVPYGTDLSALAPEVRHTGVSIDPETGVAQDFSAPVVYTVTAADGSTKRYTVTASVALSTSKDITSFSILGVSGQIGASTIAVTVPHGTNLSALAPTLAITGQSASPASGQPRNFTGPVTYTVTAADGSTKSYVVTVQIAPSSAKDITLFSIGGTAGTISGNAISLQLAHGTNVTALAPVIEHRGASVSPASGVATDFSAPVTYTVTAEDGTSRQYTVNVQVAANSAKDITSFTILGQHAQISGSTIQVTVPFGSNLGALTPTIAHTGASISPASGAAQDFGDSVVYTVTADDGSTQAYTVEVTVALNHANSITAFSIAGISGTIEDCSITLTLPYGTDLSSLAPDQLVHTGASIHPSADSYQDFRQPVVYTVTAANGDEAEYTVTVSVAPSSAKDITSFSILGLAAQIDAQNISLVLPYGTALTSLAPTIEHSGASVAPASGVPQNFSQAVTYTVTAADGSTINYVATVTAAPNAVPVVSGGPFARVFPVSNGDTIGAVQVTDVDQGQTHSFTITSDSSGGAFGIDATSGEITVADASKAVAGSFTLTVQATDDGVPPAQGSVTVTVSLASSPTAGADAAMVFVDRTTEVDLSTNDSLGTPAATFKSFGGGSLGGAVTDHPANGSSVALAGGTIALSAAGLLTVNAMTTGVYTFSYRIGNAATSDATVTLSICSDMQLGAMIVARPEEAPTTCVGTTSGTTSEYMFIPMNVAESGTYSLTATTSGTAALSGSAPGPGSLLSGDGHAGVRRTQHSEVSARKGTIGGGTPIAPASSIPHSVPNVGDLWSLNSDVSDACSSGTAKTATVKYVGSNVIVVAENDAPPGGFSAMEYQGFAWNFENIIYPAVTGVFGAPSDIDSNGRVVLYITPALNALSPPASSAVVSTQHLTRDLLSQGECPTSNAGEIIYVLAPDPTGVVNSNVRTLSSVFALSGSALAHEFGHLVLDSRRLAASKPFEEPWLDEALASLAEELSFYVATRGMATLSAGTTTIPTPTGTALTEGQNIVVANLTTGPDASRRVAAFNSYANANYGRLRTFLLNPRRYGPVSANDPDTLAGRGAGWALLRYLDDRVAAGNLSAGRAFISALVDANTTGMTNLALRANADPSLLLRDFLLALYIDDSGLPMLDVVTSPYRITSWSLTSIYVALNASYALARAQLPVFTANTPVTFSLAPGGSASYVRFAASANTPALVTMTPPSTGTSDAWYAIIRTQ